jgi:hypothetical protein
MSNAKLVSRIFTYDKNDLVYPERDSYVVYYKNNNSFGNRYESSDQVIATKESLDEGFQITPVQAASLIYSYVWNQVFNLIEHKIFTGPSTLEALEKAAVLAKNAEFPEENTKKLVSVWNGIGNSLVTTRTKSYMDLQRKISSLMVDAFQKDRLAEKLLSSDFIYYRVINSGWSRST